MNYEFLAIAHRGASGYCPENTMASFRRARELGARWQECDLRLTADDEVVVIHDSTVDRTTDGSSPVRGFSLAALQRLDAGSWFDSKFRGERIPTFSQVLDSLTPNCRLVAELKDGKNFPQIIEIAVSQVIERGLEEQVQFSAFSWDVLVEAKKLCPKLKTQVLVVLGEEGGEAPFVDGGTAPFYSNPHKLAADALAYGVDVVCPQADRIDENLVSFLHSEGLKVRAWGVNSDQGPLMLRMLEAGVDGMTANYPDRLLEVYAEFQKNRNSKPKGSY